MTLIRGLCGRRCYQTVLVVHRYQKTVSIIMPMKRYWSWTYVKWSQYFFYLSHNFFNDSMTNYLSIWLYDSWLRLVHSLQKVTESFAGIGEYHKFVLADNLRQQISFSLPNCDTENRTKYTHISCPEQFRNKLDTVLFTYRAVYLNEDWLYTYESKCSKYVPVNCRTYFEQLDYVYEFHRTSV